MVDHVVNDNLIFGFLELDQLAKLGFRLTEHLLNQRHHLIEHLALSFQRRTLRACRETNESGWPQKRRNRIVNSLGVTRRQEASLNA
jgi:hypothetical protein